MGQHIIDLENPQPSIDEWNDFRAAYKEIIQPTLDRYQLKKKNALELCQAGKFMLNIDRSIRIVDMPAPPNPDFLFTYNNQLIGLEHTRLTNPTHSPRVFSIQHLLDKAAERFQEKFPAHKICASFRFPNDEFDFSRNDQHSITDIICAYVDEHCRGIENNKPDFIESVRIMPNRIVSFYFHEHHFYGDKLATDVVSQTIATKEEKLNKYYSRNAEIKEFWLVMVIGSLSRASYELDEFTNYQMASQFDKVYLMADFDETIVQVK